MSLVARGGNRRAVTAAVTMTLTVTVTVTLIEVVVIQRHYLSLLDKQLVLIVQRHWSLWINRKPVIGTIRVICHCS